MLKAGEVALEVVLEKRTAVEELSRTGKSSRGRSLLIALTCAMIRRSYEEFLRTCHSGQATLR